MERGDCNPGDRFQILLAISEYASNLDELERYYDLVGKNQCGLSIDGFFSCVVRFSTEL